jgi:cell division protein FtsN
MLKKFYGFILLGILVLFYNGCNSAIYEIVEVEEPVEIKEEVKQPVSEIKEESKPIENKFSEKQVVSRTYVIQIGAFTDESNALKFTNSAKSKLNGQEIYYKDIDGLFKVRLGGFGSKEEALSFLSNAKNAGFADSFVVELTYIKP